MSFDTLSLHASIKKAIATLGYTTPTPVQEKAIPVILEGRDVVACAQTGTGKTAAFVLPALNRLANEPRSKHPRILVLTPTRELATQITKAAFQYGRQMRFNMASLVGGMSYQHQIRDLQRGADMIIATPGRLIDHLENKRIDLSHIEMLILDEADRMLDMGFIDDVNHIAAQTPAERQTLLFSATLDPALKRVIDQLLRDPERFDLSQKQLAAPKIQQTLYKTKHMHDKTRLLKQLLENNSIYKAIIFTATKMSADNLADELADAGFASAALHGDLRQNVRTRTLDALRRGKVQYLVATDVAARGIDIADITHVINFDLPRQVEDYVHRIGRTGRAGRDGEAISFVTKMDMTHVQRIERYLGQRLRLVQLLEGTTEVQEVSPARAFVKNDDTPFEKQSYGYGKKRENDRERSRPSSRYADKDGERSRPSRFSGEKEGSYRKSRPSSFKDKDSRGGERTSYRADRSEKTERTEFRGERSERKFGERKFGEKRFSDRSDRNERSERGGERSERKFGESRSFRGDSKPAFSGERRERTDRTDRNDRKREMNPFAKPEKNVYISDKTDRAPRRSTKTSGEGFQPVKKASFRSKSSAPAGRTFQRRERKEART